MEYLCFQLSFYNGAWIQCGCVNGNKFSVIIINYTIQPPFST